MLSTETMKKSCASPSKNGKYAQNNWLTTSRMESLMTQISKTLLQLFKLFYHYAGKFISRFGNHGFFYNHQLCIIIINETIVLS